MKNNFYVCIEVVILSALLPLIMIPIIIFLWGDIFAEGLLLRIAILFLMFGFPLILQISVTVLYAQKITVSNEYIKKTLFGIKMNHKKWEEIQYISIDKRRAINMVILSDKPIKSKPIFGYSLKAICFFNSTEKLEILKRYAPERIINELDTLLLNAQK